MSVHEHTTRAFDDEIEDIRSAVLTMGGWVEKQFASAVEAIEGGDQALVGEVLEREKAVNAMQMQADELCKRTIARRQPIAIDLRELIGAIHVINDLERIGDEAKKIAFRAGRLAGFERRASLPLERVASMGQTASAMLHDALDALARHDPAIARKVRLQDAEVDRHRESLLQATLVQIGEDPAAAPLAMDLAFVIQSIERVGDHAKNVAEQVIQIVEGLDLRHTLPDAGQR